MFSRSREISDALGGRLRLSVEGHPSGALVLLERPDQRGCDRALLDGYGAEVLWGYIMAARLALPQTLPEETIGGSFPARLRVARDPSTAILIVQDDAEPAFEIAASFWDRLGAELCLVIAHARELTRLWEARVQ